MDVIGVASSVIALLQGLSATLEAARGFHNAPKDIHLLQEQLGDFTGVLDEIERSQTSSFANPIIEGLLDKALRILRELQALVDGPLKKNGRKGKQRASWLWNRSKVESLREELREIRAAIVSIVSVTTSTTSRKLELELGVIRNMVDTTLNATSRIEGQISRNNSFNLPESSYFDTFGLSTLSNSVADGNSQQEYMLKLIYKHLQQDRAKWTKIQDNAIEVASYSNRNQPSRSDPRESETSANATNRKVTRELENTVAGILSDISPGLGQEVVYEYSLTEFRPNSPLEKSAVFFPEQYTVENFSSRISVQYLIQNELTATTRINKCAFFYAETPRKWRKVVAYFEFKKDSRHLPVLTVSSSFPVYGVRSLPRSIQAQLKILLGSSKDFYGGTEVLNIEVSEAGSEPTFDVKNINFRPVNYSASNQVHDYLDLLADMGCPQFSESEIATISGGHRVFGSSSIVHVVSFQSRICRESMFPVVDDSAFFKDGVKNFIWELKAHFLSSSARRIVSFVGVVMNDNRSEVKGYLMEYQHSLSTFLIHSRHSGRPRISWAWREKWARQLVEAVAEAHKLGLAVGGPYLWDLSLDPNQNLMLHILRRNIPSKFDFEGYVEGNLPPEHRKNQITLPSNIRQTSVWNTRSDIFQLGGTLWQLGEYELGERRNVHCDASGCQNNPHIPCQADHATPISLPWTNNEVPPYFRKIVQYCRTANPQHRLPAADLLLLFPPSLQEDFENEEAGVPHPFLHISGSVGVGCDTCGKICSGFHYHCNICSGGDFDICEDCLLKGHHCLDKFHMLLERLTSRQAGNHVSTGKQIAFDSGLEKKRGEENKT